VSISPRYEGVPIISIPGSPRDQLDPLTRQRRRLEGVLEDLQPQDWRTQSRCTGWSVQDVVAHLAGVNTFWTASVRAGLAGRPTRVLANFDPVATPEQMVAPTRDLVPQAVLAQFVSSNRELMDALGELDDEGWAAIAETPPGHLPIRLLASHALWDSWVHERDIVLPLGRVQPRHPDEVRASLGYVCALAAALVVLTGSAPARSLGVVAEDPVVRLVLRLSEGVEVHDVAPPPGAPVLRGDAVALIEALSTRAAFPAGVPEGWAPVIEGFAAVFASQR